MCRSRLRRYVLLSVFLMDKVEYSGIHAAHVRQPILLWVVFLALEEPSWSICVRVLISWHRVICIEVGSVHRYRVVHLFA